jgi:hypothetical protein
MVIQPFRKKGAQTLLAAALRTSGARVDFPKEDA